MKKTILYFLLIVLFACGNQKQTDTESQQLESSENTEIQKAEAVVTTETTMTITENHVIFFWPDTIEMAEMKAKYDEDSYNEIIADLTWYPGIAAMTLDTLNIKHVDCDKEFLVLIKSDNSEIKLKRKDVDGDMILFCIDKNHKIMWSTMFEKKHAVEYFDLK